jgi:hypothetical protein
MTTPYMTAYLPSSTFKSGPQGNIYFGRYMGLGDDVSKMTDEQLIQACQQQDSGLWNQVAREISTQIQSNPCIELEIRSKIKQNALKWGIPGAVLILGLGMLGGFLVMKLGR